MRNEKDPNSKTGKGPQDKLIKEGEGVVWEDDDDQWNIIFKIKFGLREHTEKGEQQWKKW